MNRVLSYDFLPETLSTARRTCASVRRPRRVDVFTTRPLVAVDFFLLLPDRVLLIECLPSGSISSAPLHPPCGISSAGPIRGPSAGPDVSTGILNGARDILRGAHSRVTDGPDGRIPPRTRGHILLSMETGLGMLGIVAENGPP
jgi:hypothetical protein